jgi:DNA modification methylase
MSVESVLSGESCYCLHLGDCLDYLKTLPDNCIDAVVTDPPYGMSNHTQQDIINCLTAWLAGEEYHHGKAGFMGKEWDAFVPSPTVWKEVLRVLKPGGHILCAASTRTVDLMGISLRLAGFEIRDTVEWLYGSGFPKSLDISKNIDKAAGAERDIIAIGKRSNAKGTVTNKVNGERDVEYPITTPATEAAKQFDGFGTALKPAHEPFILARKPIEKGLTTAENCLKWGTGGLDIDSCRVGNERPPTTAKDFSAWRKKEGRTDSQVATPDTDTSKGRFPANLILSDDECVKSLFPETKSGAIKPHHNSKGLASSNHEGYKREWHKNAVNLGWNIESSEGSAARFFYCAKASPSERNAGLDDLPDMKAGGLKGRNDGSLGSETIAKNHHPTVKPLSLCEYLIKLISKEGDIILDPFTGSGTTGIAALNLNRRFIGCELDNDYHRIATARIEAALNQPKQDSLV